MSKITMKQVDSFCKEAAAYYAKWHPASGHPKGWRVTRGLSPMEELESSNGRTILFRSRESAQKRADALNAVDASSSPTPQAP